MPHFKSEFLWNYLTEEAWHTLIVQWAEDHLLNSQVSSQAFPASALRLWNAILKLKGLSEDSRTPLLTFPKISLDIGSFVQIR